MARPDMDPVHVRLALKYAYIWKCRCAGLRDGLHSSDVCTVHHAVIKGMDGKVAVLRREQLPRLQAGSMPFGDGNFAARLRELPPFFANGPPLYFVPLDVMAHAGSDAPDFITLLFTAPSRVYLLLPTLLREPRWLRDLFMKARDPSSGSVVSLGAQWPVGGGMAVLLASAMRLQAYKRQRFVVWESVQVYEADEELLLPGPGPAEMGDTLYSVAVRSAVSSNGLPQAQFAYAQLAELLASANSTTGVAPTMSGVLAAGAAAARFGSAGMLPMMALQPEGGLPQDAGAADAGGSAPASGAGASAGQLLFHRRSAVLGPGPGQAQAQGQAWDSTAVAAGGSQDSDIVPWLLARYLKAVRRDRLQDLKLLLESELWRRYRFSPEEVSFLPAGERTGPSQGPGLVVDLAASNMSLPVMYTLVDAAGCHLGYRALALMVGQWDRAPPEWPGGCEALLLRYLLRHPNPLSTIAACLLVMRAELGQGSATSHSASLQGAMERFQDLQRALLGQLQDSYYRIPEEARKDAGLPLLEQILEAPPHVEPQMGAWERQAKGAAGQPPGAGAAVGAAGGGAMQPQPGAMQPQAWAAGSAPAEMLPPAPAAAVGSNGVPQVLSDYSPLRIAFHDHDTSFMSAQLVEAYNRRRWLGGEYVALTQLDGHRRLSGLDPLMPYTLLENLGFVGDAAAATFSATMRLWHLITMTSAAFFRSPRGRWTLKFCSMLTYLGLYMGVLASHQSAWQEGPAGRAWRGLQTAFCVFALGNLLEGLDMVALLHRNSAGRFLVSAPGEFLSLLIDAAALAAVLPCLVGAYGGLALSEGQRTNLLLMQAAIATLVWPRTLLVMIPLYTKLGPLVRTMARMLSEVLAFVPPWVFVTLGFAAAFQVALGDELPQFSTFVEAVLALFQASLGTFDYSGMDTLDDKRRIFASVLLTIYLVLSAVLLANLLIAIITYKYRPQEVRAQSIFDLAETVDRYRFQVQHHLACSPFNVLMLLLAWLPSCHVAKVPPYEWVKWGLVPLDGLTFATPDYPSVPAGRAELPHLCYLLTLFPLMMLAANVLYYAHAPYCILYFAAIGHKRFLRELTGSGSKSEGAATAPAAASKAHSQTGQRPGGTHMAGRSSLDVGSGPAASAPSSATAASAAGSGSAARRRSMLQGAGTASGSGRGVGSSGSYKLEGIEGIDDVLDPGSAAVPPYMLLLELVTLAGLRRAALGALRFCAMLLVGAVLYLGLLGLLGGTVGCCLYPWVGALLVSVRRVVVGAWRGAVRRGGAQAGGGGGGGFWWWPGGGGGGEAGEGKQEAAGQRAGGAVRESSARWVALTKAARTRSRRATYLARGQIEAAIRTVYTPAMLAQLGLMGQISAGAFGGAASVGVAVRATRTGFVAAPVRAPVVVSSKLAAFAAADAGGRPSLAGAAAAGADPGGFCSVLSFGAPGGGGSGIGLPAGGGDAAAAAAAAAATTSTSGALARVSEGGEDARSAGFGSAPHLNPNLITSTSSNLDAAAVAQSVKLLQQQPAPQAPPPSRPRTTAGRNNSSVSFGGASAASAGLFLDAVQYASQQQQQYLSLGPSRPVTAGLQQLGGGGGGSYGRMSTGGAGAAGGDGVVALAHQLSDLQAQVSQMAAALQQLANASMMPSQGLLAPSMRQRPGSGSDGLG